jgi:hypothetical protein
MCFVQDQYAIQALTTRRTNPTLGKGIRDGSSVGSLYYFDVLSRENVVE